MAQIFISYRRKDSHEFARSLYLLLDKLYPREVFLDAEAIERGEDFVDKILKELGSCKVLIAIIGESWLDGIDRDEDYVRLEIAQALKRKLFRPDVLPILREGVPMPAAHEVPQEIAKLRRFNATEVRVGYFEQDLGPVLHRVAKRIGPPHSKARFWEWLWWFLRRPAVRSVAAMLSFSAGYFYYEFSDRSVHVRVVPKTVAAPQELEVFWRGRLKNEYAKDPDPAVNLPRFESENGQRLDHPWMFRVAREHRKKYEPPFTAWARSKNPAVGHCFEGSKPFALGPLPWGHNVSIPIRVVKCPEARAREPIDSLRLDGTRGVE